jgi:GrpB-like predicted nucleotidyltransferase (UPF0157 family)
MNTRAGETLDERVARVLRAEIELAEPDPRWPDWSSAESTYLRRILPADLLGRIEHVGSTAVPGLVAKPIVDMLIEVTDPERAARLLPEALRPPAYDHFWKPPNAAGGKPYSWLIREQGVRTPISSAAWLHASAPIVKATQRRRRPSSRRSWRSPPFGVRPASATKGSRPPANLR